MKMICCMDAVLRYLGIFFLAPVLLMSCADDNKAYCYAAGIPHRYADR